MATYYVDPSAGVNGNGSIGSPYNTPASAPVAAGDALLFKRGTTWNTIINVVSGTASAPTYYGAYGDPAAPKPRLWVNDSACFQLHDRRWVTIEDFDLAQATVACVFGYQDTTNNGTGITLRRLDCHDAGSGWIIYPFTFGGAIISQFLAEDCVVERMASAGSSIYGRVSSAMIRRCRFDRCAQTDPNGSHGATSFAHRYDADAGGFTLVSGTRYSKSLTNLLDSTGIFGTPTQVFAVVRRTGTQLRLTNAGATTTPAVGQYGVSGGVVYFDFGQAIGSDRIMVYVGEATGIVYEDCEFSRTKRSNFEGAGVQADDGSVITVRRCKSWGNEGPGVVFNQGAGNIVESCEIWGNLAQGVQTAIDDQTIVRNNTIQNNGGDGIAFLFQSTGTSHTASNNVITGNTGAGINGPATVTAANNAITGTTHTGGVTPTGTITSGLLLNGAQPLPGSPLLTGGADLGAIRDIRRIQGRRHIGAYAAARLTS